MKLAFWICLIIVLAQVSGGVRAVRAAAPGALSDKYVVQFDARDWSMVMVVNGIPVEYRNTENGVSQINKWIKSGTNQLEVFALAKKSTRQARPLTIDVFSAPSGRQDTPHQLLQLTVDNGAGPRKEIMKSGEFQAPSRTNWIWEKASLIGDLSAADKQAINGIFEQLCTAVIKKDAKALSKLFTTAAALQSQETGLNPDAILNETNNQFEAIFKINSPADIIDLKKIAMRASSHGVLLFPDPESSRDDLIHVGDPTDPTKSFGWSKIIFCKIDGNWVIID